MKTVLIVDGICPRGLPMIRYLASTGEYHVLVFTKTTTCAGARAASSLPSVTLLLNRSSTGYDLSTFATAARRCPSILVCSSPANSEGKEGVQWGARLVQSASSAGVKHLVFLTMDLERRQCSTDGMRCRHCAKVGDCILKMATDFLHSQNKAPMAWTIIRSPPSGAVSCQSSSLEAERCLTATQLRNLAYYVNWVFANPDHSTGLDFAVPTAEPSGVGISTDGKRRDPRTESSTPPVGPSHKSGNFRPNTASYMDAGRARAIRQWAARSSTATKKDSDSGESIMEEEDDEVSGSESE